MKVTGFGIESGVTVTLWEDLWVDATLHPLSPSLVVLPDFLSSSVHNGAWVILVESLGWSMPPPFVGCLTSTTCPSVVPHPSPCYADSFGIYSSNSCGWSLVPDATVVVGDRVMCVLLWQLVSFEWRLSFSIPQPENIRYLPPVA